MHEFWFYGAGDGSWDDGLMALEAEEEYADEVAHDPTLLSLQEIDDGWGSCLYFLSSEGFELRWSAEALDYSRL